MKKISIKDLYAGKPDAKDEINFEGQDSFIKTFVVADHFNIDSLTNGNHCFITGFKGTGKTALLFYLDSLFKTVDSATCTSYIFFKEDFTDSRRADLEALSRRTLSSISVEPGALTDIPDFEYIWRWLFLKHFVSDNDSFNGNLFVADEKWIEFEKRVSQIKDPRNSRKVYIPNKIKIAAPFKDPSSLSEITPELEVDFQKPESRQFRQFIELVDQAEAAFSQLSRTDIPYYIFVDELEAYYGEAKVFLRDLALIRDLILTVKHFNTLIAKAGMEKTKLLCSVRSEILTAISRFIITKEIVTTQQPRLKI